MFIGHWNGMQGVIDSMTNPKALLGDYVMMDPQSLSLSVFRGCEYSPKKGEGRHLHVEHPICSRGNASCKNAAYNEAA